MRQETKRLATMTVLLGFFVIMLDTTIVNVSLAHIGKDLHGTTASLQWVVDAYTLSFAALLLSAGTACDRLGAQRIYLFGLIEAYSATGKIHLRQQEENQKENAI